MTEDTIMLTGNKNVLPQLPLRQSMYEQCINQFMILVFRIE